MNHGVTLLVGKGKGGKAHSRHRQVARLSGPSHHFAGVAFSFRGRLTGRVRRLSHLSAVLPTVYRSAILRDPGQLIAPFNGDSGSGGS